MMKNRLWTCVRFELSRLVPISLIFLAIYTGSCLLLLTFLGSTQGEGYTNINLSFAAFIFLFAALSSTYGNFYNNLILFGNTRNTILASYFITSIVFSAFFAVLSQLSDLLMSAVSGPLGFSFTPLLDSAYGPTNVAEKLLWFFALLLIAACFSQLFGALDYKFGKAFKIIFWVSFGLSWMLVVPAVRLDTLLKAAKWYFAYGTPHGAALNGLHMIVTAAVFSAGCYLLARRQPQKA